MSLSDWAKAQWLTELKSSREEIGNLLGVADRDLKDCLAPTHPECDEADLRATLKAVAELEPITIFHEPINIRAENVARIGAQATAMGVRLRTEVFATRESWQDYAVSALHTVSQLARELGLAKQLHLWPDKSLGNQALADRMPNPQSYLRRLEQWWHRISEWPG